MIVEEIVRKYADYLSSINVQDCDACLKYLYKAEGNKEINVIANKKFSANEINNKSQFESAAKAILKYCEKFDNISPVNRELRNSRIADLKKDRSIYSTDEKIRNGIERASKPEAMPKDINYVNQERHFLMKLANHSKTNPESILGDLGRIFEYEFPINESNERFGRVDLISYNGSTNTLYLIEAKTTIGTKDTLLRAILEIKAYSQALKDHFSNPKSFFRQMNYEIIIGNYETLKIKRALLFTRYDSMPSAMTMAEEQFIQRTTFPYTHELLSKWGIDVFRVTEVEPYMPNGQSGKYRTELLFSAD